MKNESGFSTFDCSKPFLVTFSVVYDYKGRKREQIMENTPFVSGDNEEESVSDFEAFEDDDNESDEEAEEEKETKRRVLFGGESNSESATDESRSAEKTEDKKSFFAELLKEQEDIEGNDENLVEPDSEQFIGAAEDSLEGVNEEFQDLVTDRLQDVESTIGDSPEGEVGELVADASFLTTVGERMSTGLSPSESMEEAFEDVIDDVTEDVVDDEKGEQDLPLPEMAVPEAQEEHESDIDDPPQVQTSSGGRSSSPPPTPPPRIPYTPTLTPTRNIPGASGGGGVRPPILPSPNIMPPSSQGPNVMNPNTVSSDIELTPDSPDVSRMNSLYYRDRRRGDLLLGGALGYLFGRRRGRKKAEARLEPEISNRDSEINKLTGDLERSESLVKKAASESLEKEYKHTEELKEVSDTASVPEKTAIPPRPEVIPAESLEQEIREVIEQEMEFEQTLTAEAVPTEAELKETAPLNDYVLERAKDLKAEATIAEKELKEKQRLAVERIKKQQASKERPMEKTKEINKMNLPEFLEVASRISVDSTTLRELYERGRIDAVGLRRVVTEYSKGNDYERLITDSLKSAEVKQGLRIEAKKEEKDVPYRARVENVVSPATMNKENSVTAAQSMSGPSLQAESSSSRLEEQNEDEVSLLVSGKTATVLGILAGITITALIILYSNSL